MKLHQKLGLLIALMLLVAACDTAYGPEYRADGNPAKLMGKKWLWVGYTTMSGGYFTDVPPNNFFEIKDSSITGASGCNGFWGSCSVDRSVITSHDFMSQLVYCPSRRDFTCSLEGPVQDRQRDSMLVLIPEAGDMVHLVFKQQ